MRRFWIGLLVLGLIAAFSMPALAADVKFSGEFFAAGYWESNRLLKDNDQVAQRYYASRLQINPVIQVADGLRLVTRFEAIERVWGQDPIGTTPTATNLRNTAEEQNISFRRAYLSAKILGGTLDVGYMGGGYLGIELLAYEYDVPRIKYTYATGPFVFVALTEKGFSSSAALNPAGVQSPKGAGGGEKSLLNGTSDSDYDKYGLMAIYNLAKSQAGLGYVRYIINTAEFPGGSDVKRAFNVWVPYVKANLGPLYLEGDIIWAQGKWAQYPHGSTSTDMDINSFSYLVKAKYTDGPLYFGAEVAQVGGDDPNTADKHEGAPFNQENGYAYWQPTLVLWNDWTNRWTGTANGGANTVTTSLGGLPTNVNLYQVFGGYKPLPKLELAAAFTIARANQKPSNSYVSDDYGKEFDISATYKIYDNLSYYVGYGYLWVGDYFKGTSDANVVGNDWLLMHKLTLSF